MACPCLRSTFLEEVGESLVPPPVAAAAAVPVEAAVADGGDVLPAVAQLDVVEEGGRQWPRGGGGGYARSDDSGHGQILLGKPSAAIRMDNFPPSSELSTG